MRALSKEQKTKTHALIVLGAPPTPGIVNGGQSLRARLYPQRKSEGADVLPLTAPSPLPQFTSHCSPHFKNSPALLSYKGVGKGAKGEPAAAYLLARVQRRWLAFGVH